MAHESLIKQSEISRIFLPPAPDVDLHRHFNREYWIRHFPRVGWMELDRVETVEDELYHEAVKQEFKEPIFIPAYIEINPSAQELQKWGIDEPKEVMLRFSTVVLQDFNLGVSDIRIGDKIVWDNIEYEIMTHHRDKYWFNQVIPFEIMCTLNRYRQGI